jgi:hypothetical protein
MYQSRYLFTRKVSPFLGIAVILIFTLVMAGTILVQVKNLEQLQKPVPLFVKPPPR